MMASRNSPTGEPLFSPNDIARLFQLVSDIADRGHLYPSEVIERLEHEIAPPPLERDPSISGLVAEAATASAEPRRPAMVSPAQLTAQDLELFFCADPE